MIGEGMAEELMERRVRMKREEKKEKARTKAKKAKKSKKGAPAADRALNREKERLEKRPRSKDVFAEGYVFLVKSTREEGMIVVCDHEYLADTIDDMIQSSLMRAEVLNLDDDGLPERADHQQAFQELTNRIMVAPITAHDGSGLTAQMISAGSSYHREPEQYSGFATSFTIGWRPAAEFVMQEVKEYQLALIEEID